MHANPLGNPNSALSNRVVIPVSVRDFWHYELEALHSAYISYGVEHSLLSGVS